MIAAASAPVNRRAVDIDRVTEMRVRRVDCPVCGATVGRACIYPDMLVPSGWIFGHAGRYQVVMDAGLVPSWTAGFRVSTPATT